MGDSHTTTTTTIKTECCTAPTAKKLKLESKTLSIYAAADASKGILGFISYFANADHDCPKVLGTLWKIRILYVMI